MTFKRRIFCCDDMKLMIFYVIMTVKQCFIVMTFNPRCFPAVSLNWQCEDIWCEDNYPLIFCYDDVKSAMICGNDTKLMRCFANYITRATFASIPNHHHVIFGLKPKMRKSVCNDWLFSICYWKYMCRACLWRTLSSVSVNLQRIQNISHVKFLFVLCRSKVHCI